MTENVPATKSKAEQDQEWLLARATKIAALVPRGVKNYDPAKQIRQFAIEAMTNPKLMNCTPVSVLISLCQAAALGLEIGSGLGHAYLVPYNRNVAPRGEAKKWVSEAKLIPGYKGLIYLAHRSGAVKQLSSYAVHANDQFDVFLGTEPRIVHIPKYSGDRGDVVAFYAVAELPLGGREFSVMTKAEVDAVRERSKSKDDGPWVTDYNEMGRKTVAKRTLKYVPLATDDQRATLLRALSADDAVEYGDAIDVSAALGIAVDEQQPQQIAAPSSGDVLDAALGDTDKFDPAVSAQLDREEAEAQK